ncbi:MAG: YqgE/AlgH family protein [Pararhodobacter sp.]|nr:YqgE/AlgH family protein [Pararhodobacter sp.]
MDFDLTGKLLISTPAMGDPRFAHSVILLCAHSREGAFGLVVNRPIAQLTLADILSQLDIEPGEGATGQPVLAGGPVETARGFVLHSDEGRAGAKDDEASQKLPGDMALTASTGILSAIAQGQGPRQWLLALGYAGWGPGQLEGEIAQNAWLTCDARDDLVFDPSPGDGQWHAALKSIGVDPLTLSAVAGRA